MDSRDLDRDELDPRPPPGRNREGGSPLAVS